MEELVPMPAQPAIARLTSHAGTGDIAFARGRAGAGPSGWISRFGCWNWRRADSSAAPLQFISGDMTHLPFPLRRRSIW